MVTKQERLQIIFEAIAKMGEAKKAIQSMEGMDDAAGKVEKKSELAGHAMKFLEGAVIGAGAAFLKSIPSMLEQAQTAERGKTALIAYAGGARQAEETLKAVIDASGGVISKMDGVAAANRLMAMGLANSAAEAGKLTQIAITLGATMGKGPQQSIEEFSLMLANTSIPRLDTYGLSASKVRGRMGELQAQTAGLDRQTAFLNAVMEIGSDKLMALDAAGFEAGSNLDKLNAKIADLKLGVSTWLSNGLMPWIDGYSRLKEVGDSIPGKIREHTQEVIYNTSSYEEYRAEIERLLEVMPQYKDDIILLTESQYNAFRSTETLSSETERLTGWAAAAGMELGNYKNSTDDLKASTDKLTVSLGDLTKARIGQEALAALNKQLEEGNITTEQYNQMLEFIGNNFLGLSDAEVDADIALANLNQSFADNKINLDQYQLGLLAVQSMLNNLPSSVSTTHHFYEEHHGYGSGGGGSVPGQGGQTSEPGPVGGGGGGGDVVVYGDEGEVVTGGMRALGGSVNRGQAYIVGEKGPEIFVPPWAGQVVPNRETMEYINKVREATGMGSRRVVYIYGDLVFPNVLDGQGLMEQLQDLML